MKRQKILNWLEQHSTAVGSGIALIVLCLGVIYSLHLGEKIRYYDAVEYLALAKNIVETRTFAFEESGITASRPPGYPAFLSGLLSLGAGVIIFRIANFLLLGISIILMYHLAAAMGGKAAGALAAAAVMGYPALFYTAGTVYPQTLAATLFLAILVLIGVDKPPDTYRSLCAGICSGLLILTVPTFVFALLVVLLWLSVSYRRRAWKAAVAMVLPAVLILSAWSYRNYRVFGEFVFVSTNSGLNLILGNSENARASSGPNTDISGYREQSLKMPEVKRDKFLRARAIEWILMNKKDALILYGKKVLHYFNYRDELGNENLESRFKDRIMFASYYFFLALFLFRLILWRWIKPASKELLFIGLYGANAFFMALFFTRIRFRLPFDYLLIALAALFITALLRGSHSGERLDSRLKESIS